MSFKDTLVYQTLPNSERNKNKKQHCRNHCGVPEVRKQIKLKKNPQNSSVTATPSGEGQNEPGKCVAQAVAVRGGRTLLSTTGRQLRARGTGWRCQGRAVTQSFPQSNVTPSLTGEGRSLWERYWRPLLPPTLKMPKEDWFFFSATWIGLKGIVPNLLDAWNSKKSLFKHN